jgi:uncharacterized phage protein gp47/JayE
MTSTYDAAGVSMDRYDDILARMVALAVEWKGTSLSTDEKYLFGHLLRQMAYESDTVNEKTQEVYDAMSISNNSGVPLDNILELIDLPRQAAAPSTATETFTASKATTVPAGTTVRTASNVYWTTDEELVFSGAGSDTVGITCTRDGPNNAEIGEIDTLVSTVVGITSVTNAAAAIPGRFIETDAELKLRHSTAVATSGERDAASISEAIGNVDAVSAVLVYEPADASEIWVYVIGGDEDEIAAAMDPQVGAGLAPILQGTTSVDVYSATLKQDRTMKFTYGTDVDVYIDLAIQITGLFPADGDYQITAAIAELFDGINLGDDILYLQISGYVYRVPGVIIQSLKIGLTVSPTGTVDIPANNGQRLSAGIVRDDTGVIIASNIVISHV